MQGPSSLNTNQLPTLFGWGIIPSDIHRLRVLPPASLSPPLPWPERERDMGSTEASLLAPVPASCVCGLGLQCDVAGLCLIQ